MVNTRKLKGKMVEMDINVENLSEKMGINKATLYRKLDSENFTVNEVSVIASALELNKEEMIDIFFADVVA